LTIEDFRTGSHLTESELPSEVRQSSACFEGIASVVRLPDLAFKQRDVLCQNNHQGVGGEFNFDEASTHSEVDQGRDGL
jgi:hypothetical protein